MKRLFKYVNLILIAGMLLYQSCATMNQQKSRADYQKEIREIEARLKINPGDALALRDIGVILYKIEQFAPARNYLIKSFELNPKDAKTNAYLGLVFEAENRKKLAVKVYKRYVKLPTSSQFRKLMEGRYLLLSREMIRDDIRERISQEAQLGVSQISPNAIAVFPLTYKGKNKQYAPLGIGFSEMMITDLSQVPGLTLIERIRLQALMEEMALGQSGMVEQTAAPRYGKLVSAGKIVHGTYNVQDDNELQFEIALWDVMNEQYPDFNNKNDLLNNLFKLEKDYVFALIDELGIALTPQQQQKILHVPTKNIQAFLAYCQGLEHEDTGQFEIAAKYFQQAVKIDPGFTRASQKANASQSQSLATAVETVAPKPGMQERSPLASRANQNLLANRLQNLSTNVGSNFVPGQDSRKSVEEAQQSGLEVFGDLPLPPIPPIRP